MTLRTIFWFGFILAAFTTQGQFYAPQTEYHDKAQRLFPVELVRVLAARENAQTQSLTEITYQISVDTNQITSWQIQCLKDKTPVKEIKVSYPLDLTRKGPQFYRDIFKQVWKAGDWSKTGSITPAQLSDRFWQGAELNGMAREDGLVAAFNLLGSKEKIAEERLAPTMAGLLSHIPMPSLSGGVTLDAVLLARGAAWLCLSESMLSDPSTASDENWAPIIFMAGRQNDASTLWKSKVAREQNSDKPTLFLWWNVFLNQPTVHEAIGFVATPKQRRFAMPMIAYYSRLEEMQGHAADAVWILYHNDKRQFYDLHNYGAFFAVHTDVSGGRLLEGAWPALFRLAWLETLKKMPVSSCDYTGHLEKLKGIAEAEVLRDKDEESSLIGLKKLTPLLELGYEQGQGALIPASAVTARDLLNYGWEMNGLLMGARYRFVDHMWGIPDLAQKIYKDSTRDIQGQAPFFQNDLQKSIFNFQDSIYRLQMVDELGYRSTVLYQPFLHETTNTMDAARLYYKRCWARPYDVRVQAWTLSESTSANDAIKLFKQYHEQCGPISDTITLESARDWFSREELQKYPELKQLCVEIAEHATDVTELQIHTIRDKYNGLPSSALGQTLEELFWKNPDSGIEQDVLNHYILGGAWKSSERFYKQMREIVDHSVTYANTLGPQVWMLAFVSGDEELMQMAVEDSDCGSYIAMRTAVWNYAAHNQIGKMEKQIDEIIERYESEKGPKSEGRLMKNFIPLIPALKDPKDRRHAEALDYFGKANTAVILRWVLIKKYNLSADDAIRFLGGQETDRLRRVLVLSLKNDKEHLRAAFEDYGNNEPNKGAGRPLATWIEVHALDVPVGIEEKDLKPTNVKSIHQILVEKTGGK